MLAHNFIEFAHCEIHARTRPKFPDGDLVLIPLATTHAAAHMEHKYLIFVLGVGTESETIDCWILRGPLSAFNG